LKYRVIKEHKPNNSKPIKVKKGEKVKIGKISGMEDGWSNWVYCYSLDNNTEGWTPEQIIQIENDYGIISHDYSAKELEVSESNIVDGEFELNGWLWCSILNKSEFGWLPKEKIVELHEV
jgi:hypothetical protein